MQISDHVVVLEYGRKISDGDPTHVKSDPRVIAAYLGVDDEEVVDVLTEVGDEQVIETLDAEPDRAHGPGDSSSMMAGSISDTVAHSDEMGERITVARGASKAEQVDRLEAAHAKPASLADIPGKPTSSAKKPPAKPSVAGSTSVKSPVKGPAKPAANKAPAAAPVKSTGTSAKAPDKSPAKMAVAPATRLKKAEAKPAARAPAKAAAPAAARPAAAKPAAKPTAAKPATAALPADDILAIKGIGPINKKKLNEHGIHRFDQIAAWKKADIIAVEKYLEFDGRIEREDWIGQAKQLAKAAAAAAKRGGKN
jgi:branched-chain amino acid transport system ATP-binding protein